MPKATLSLTNYAAGELSPVLFARNDVAAYNMGAATIENFVVSQYGGLIRRPGTYFVKEVKSSSNFTRLIPFVFNTDQTYILEFGNLYIRFYKDEGNLTSGGSPYEVSTPYTSAQLPDLQFAQTGDLIYIAHNSHAPRKLSRSGDTTWTLTNLMLKNTTTVFKRGPFLDDNITAVTITPSGDTGANVTLTASAATFNANHVGSFWKVKEGVVHIDTYTSTTVVKGDVQLNLMVLLVISTLVLQLQLIGLKVHGLLLKGIHAL